MRRVPLPIDPLIPEIVDSLERNTVTLLRAEPGAGKTTRVPPAIVEAGLGAVYVLEPRRIAARMAARRVAYELDDEVGGVVGYQVRFEEAGSKRTRIWYATEGILTRKLLGEGLPRDVQTVVLDEFHERHLETDLALALLRKRLAAEHKLRLLIMSATLAGVDLARKLGGAPLIEAPGRVFPVAIRYMPHSSAPLEEQVAGAVGTLLAETSGSVLAFLPGAAEIRRSIQSCGPVAARHGARVLPLHGDLSPDEQDLAVAPGGRKVICSTNIAESSVTIEGIEAVVDSGLARMMRHSPWSGLSRLALERVSKASAIQRAGRAGRTAPGVAIRLYSQEDFARRPEEIPAEILRTDLCQMVLQLASAGIRPEQLEWLDRPPDTMLEHARDLLARLGALEAGHTITETGRAMARMPVHPRLSRLALAAAHLGATREGCRVAAKLAEGRMRRSNDSTRPDTVADIEAFLEQPETYSTKKLSRQLEQLCPPSLSPDPEALEKAVLLGFPDRVGRRRGEVVLLSNGASGRFESGRHFQAEFLVAVEVQDLGGKEASMVGIATPIRADWLLEYFPERVEARQEVRWNREAERVEEFQSLLYDELILEETQARPTNLDAASAILASKVLEAGIERFTNVEELAAFLRRIRFAAAQDRDVVLPPDLIGRAVSDLCAGSTSLAEIRGAASRGGFIRLLQSTLPMRLIEEIAPIHINLPSGRRVRIEYHDDGQAPSVASRLQDFFGMKETPTVSRGRVPLVLQLLAPNHRPVQVTTDLVSFWKNLYPQMRRELSRRYPKHAWPESPV